MKRIFLAIFGVIIISSGLGLGQQGQWIPPLPMPMEPMAVPYQSYSSQTAPRGASFRGPVRRGTHSGIGFNRTPIPFQSPRTTEVSPYSWSSVQYQPVPISGNVIPVRNFSGPVPSRGTVIETPPTIPAPPQIVPQVSPVPSEKPVTTITKPETPLPVIAPPQAKQRVITPDSAPLPLKSDFKPKSDIPIIAKPKPVGKENKPVLPSSELRTPPVVLLEEFEESEVVIFEEPAVENATVENMVDETIEVLDNGDETDITPLPKSEEMDVPAEKAIESTDENPFGF